MISPEEITDATLSLMQWLQNQNIGVEDAPVVLGNTIVNIVYSIAVDRAADPQRMLKELHRDMTRLMEELP